MEEKEKKRTETEQARQDFMREELLERMDSKDYQPFTDVELTGYFGYGGKDAGLFISLLDQMTEDGEIFLTKKGKYVLPKAQGLVVGTFSKHKKGFGFVIPRGETEQEDLFIPPGAMGSAMNGDLVAARVMGAEETRRSSEGRIERILKRGCTEVVGTFSRQKRFGFVIPEDRRLTEDIFVREANCRDAQTGDKVVVRITVWPESGPTADHHRKGTGGRGSQSRFGRGRDSGRSVERNAEGMITEIISRRDETGGDIKAIIRQYHLTQEYPPEAEAEAKKAADLDEPFVGEELRGRRDLRERTVFTIDGADAKDFDDAVSIQRTDDGSFLLGVHIADVSHYVSEDGFLDQEAMKRGCSVYLVDQVIPMLPEVLSNGSCSLNPDVDRLTLSVDMKIDAQGNIVDHDIYESVIHSDFRLVYDEVSDLLEHGDPVQTERYEGILDDLHEMERLAALLRGKREARGSLDFDFDEAHITLNEEGIPISVETAQRRVANRMIEEFMLAANETVAEHFYWMEIPFVYRIHEKPAVEKIEEFSRFLQGFGLRLKGNAENIHPRALAEIIEAVSGKPEEHVINTVLLRSMKKAFYGTECQGHFGLGVKYYCHFTSPIRRYPDLMIHRIIKEVLNGKLDRRRTAYLKKRTEEASAVSSAAERVAQELEREVEKLKMAEYMTYHVGERHTGVISGVAGFGFFVEIENTIEGLVRAASLNDDFYEYEPDKYRLIGRRHHRIFALGDKVEILVESVDVAAREINFIVF